MSSFRIAACLLASLVASGCATIVSGSTQTLVLTSEPPGATVEIEPGWYKVTTPTELEVKRADGPFRITFRKENYQPYRVNVQALTNPWVIGSIALGLFPAIID